MLQTCWMERKIYTENHSSCMVSQSMYRPPYTMWIYKYLSRPPSSSSSSLGSRIVSRGLANVSKLACLVLSSMQVVSPPLGWSPLSSFLVIYMVSKLWHARSIGHLWGGSYALPRTISFFSQYWLYLWLLSSLWSRCWYFYPCMRCWAYFFPFWSVRPHVCSVPV